MGREIEVSLKGVSLELAKNVRFMAGLPPIQGIVGARAKTDDDPEDVWRGRLETIYRGLLEANPKYLTVSYSSIRTSQAIDVDAASDGVQEIVQVERQIAGDAVRIMPSSRLESKDKSGFLATVLQLKPGEVSVSATTVHHKGETSSADDLVLAAGTPVYSDVSGDVFGVVTVETDLEESIRDMLVTTVEAGRKRLCRRR